MATKNSSNQKQTNPLLVILPISLIGVLIAVIIITQANLFSNPLSQVQLAEGKRLYDLKCASCHGPQGEGQYPNAPNVPDANGLIGAPPHNSTGHTWHHADTMLFKQVKTGSNIQGFHPMPAFGSELSDEQITIVLGYIKTWWTNDQRIAQATVSARQ